jgi:hypothetical protein
MFSKKEFVRRDPYFASVEAEKPIRLDEARLDAWALALGQQRGGDRPAFRAHRGELPDVDFSRAVPARRKAGLIARLISRLFGREGQPGVSETASGAVAEDDAALGESRLKAYVRLIETEASGRKAGPDAPAATRKHSRAA